MRKPRRLILIPATLVAVFWIASLCSCGGDDSVDPVKMVYQIADQQLKAGYFEICWSQLNKENSQVPNGRYGVRIKAGNYENIVAFAIQTQAVHVPSPPGCDTCTVSARKIGGEIPDNFGITLNERTYAVGDSVAIAYALPVSCRCLIEVVQE